MTPKEKAKELVEKYDKIELLKDFDGMYHELAIECAKILVDEIIKAPSHIDIPDKYEEYIDFRSYFDYWKEVKQELEKL